MTASSARCMRGVGWVMWANTVGVFVMAAQIAVSIWSAVRSEAMSK